METKFIPMAKNAIEGLNTMRCAFCILGRSGEECKPCGMPKGNNSATMWKLQKLW